MMTKEELLNGVPTANYLSEQFSNLSMSMEDNIKRLIKEGSATSQITFEEANEYVRHPALNENVYLGGVGIEIDDTTGEEELAIYGEDDEYIDVFGCIDYDSQIAIYTAVYNYFKNQDND